MNKETRRFVLGLIYIFWFGRAAVVSISIISNSETNGPWYEWIVLFGSLLLMYHGHKLITKDL